MFRQTYHYMAMVLEDVVADELDHRAKLLEKSKADLVDFYVRKYQREAIASIIEKHTEKKGVFTVFDAGKNNLTQSETSQHNEISLQLLNVLQKPIGLEKTHMEGLVTSGGKINYLYSLLFFPDWNWSVFYVVSDEYIHETVRSIFTRTIAVISLMMLLVVVSIFWLLNRFIFTQVVVLQQAAKSISEKKENISIDIDSNDELGQLARSMERMSSEIQLYDRQQKELLMDSEQLNTELEFTNERLRLLNNEIDNQVKERTTSLEKVQQELFENIEQMKEELKNSKEKNNRLIRKLSELTLKQSDMVIHHNELVSNLKQNHNDKMNRNDQFKSVTAKGD